MKFVKKAGTAVGSILDTTTEAVEILHDGVLAIREFSREWKDDAKVAVFIGKSEKLKEQGEALEALGYTILPEHVVVNERGYPELDLTAIMKSKPAQETK